VKNLELKPPHSCSDHRFHRGFYISTKKGRRGKRGRKMTTKMIKMKDEDHVDYHHDGGGSGGDGGGGGGDKTLTRRKYIHLWNLVSWDSSVGIGTRYEMEGPRIECRWGEIFRNRSDSALESIQPPT